MAITSRAQANKILAEAKAKKDARLAKADAVETKAEAKAEPETKEGKK